MDKEDSMEIEGIELQIKVKDLLKFIRYLVSMGLNVVPIFEQHLPDGSKLSIYELSIGDDHIGAIQVRYIDSYYKAFHRIFTLKSTPRFETRGDEVKYKYWAVPVEPTIIKIEGASMESVIGILSKYIDEYPNPEAKETLEIYRRKNLGF
ncbi:MAG: hypothetical protein DRN53_03585 [Thermoprotei archaeon]|nr:MAG: hypothetical protein DRN53_03585 [Thermoprotei archaeon]